MKRLGYNSTFKAVYDTENENEVIFSTRLEYDLAVLLNRDEMDEDVINEVVSIFNEYNNLADVDDYLREEGECSQDEREIILESLFYLVG